MARYLRSRRVLGVLAAALLVSGGLAYGAVRSVASPSLPAISPQALITHVLEAASARPPVSGTLATHVALGLPEVPDQGPGSDATGFAKILSYVNGDHRVRVWHSTDGMKVAELLPAAEASFTANRQEAWGWDSASFTAYHLVRPASSGPTETPPQGLQQLTPDAIAARILSGLSPSTSVGVGDPVTVAGRDAYALVLTPQTDRTLVGRVELDVDAEHWVPLRVAVFARGVDTPAVSVGYTAVGFGPIDPSTFTFSPPSGAKVVQVPAGAEGPSAGTPPSPLAGGHPETRTFGAGWASVLAIRTPSPASLRASANGLDLASFLPLSGPLFSVRLVDRGDHGWLLVGAVPQSALAALEPELS